MKTIHGILYSLMLLALFGLSGCATTYVHVGPNWDTIHNLEASEIPIKVKVYGTSSAKLGDTLKFTVTSEKSGRLWVVQVDPNDELLQLFPNNVSGTNWIDGGKSLTVPPCQGRLGYYSSAACGAIHRGLYCHRSRYGS